MAGDPPSPPLQFDMVTTVELNVLTHCTTHGVEICGVESPTFFDYNILGLCDYGAVNAKAGYC